MVRKPRPNESSYWASRDNHACKYHGEYLPLQRATGTEGKLYWFLLSKIEALQNEEKQWPCSIEPVWKPCPGSGCHGHLRITYGFPRWKNPLVLRVYYIGVTHPKDLDPVYFPMLWVTRKDVSGDFLLDFEYVRNVPSEESPWFGIGRPAVLRKEEILHLIRQWEAWPSGS